MEWAALFPTPGYYQHPPSLSPLPFMGLGKFIARRIHHMRAGKSYLAAHPTWSSCDADTSCPRCGLDQKPSSMPSYPAPRDSTAGRATSTALLT